MKNKTIKKNNNLRNITTKHNKKTKKKTNKKGKSNILNKSNKINRKNKKLLIGGNYNDNFFSLKLEENFERPITEKDVFLYKFMEKYIKNLNPETDILNNDIYKTYRKYRNDYKTKDTSNTKNQNLREIRLNYYLKSVMSIMKTEKETFSHSKINFENKPIDLYNEVNKIKNNYDENVKSKLEKTDNKNTYYIDYHGSYFKEDLKLYTVPDNIIIHFFTPLNYLSSININNIAEEQGKEFKILKSQLSDKNSIAENISDLLKINCFKDMITFLPGQRCFDINLSINTNEKFFKDIMGIYKINEKLENYKKYRHFENIKLSKIIESGDIEKSKGITTIYIKCCRSCNNNVDDLTIETMYIYENFIKQLNNLLLNIEKPSEIEKVCEKSYTVKTSLWSSINSEAGQNLRLTSKQNKTNEERINKIIKFYKNESKTDTDTKNFKSTIKDEFSDVEIDVLLYYILGGDKSFDIINFIYLNIDDVNNKELFIKKIYINSLKIIKNKYHNIIGILKYLFTKYIDILVNVVTIDLLTPLHITSLYNYTNIAELLLKHNDIDVNIQNKNKDTPLHIALINGYTEIAELLLKHNHIMVNIQNKNDNTPLHIALINEYPEIAELLLKHKDIKVNIQNKDNNTPLHIALTNGYTDIAKLLLKRGDINVNIQDNYKQTSLHIAVNNNNSDIVELLLEREDINVNIQDNYKQTPLHIAVNNNNSEIAELLLDVDNINVDLIDRSGKTPLHIAVNNNNSDIVKLLLDVDNINVDLIDKSGKTPLNIAVNNNNSYIIKLLSEDRDTYDTMANEFHDKYNKKTNKKGKSNKYTKKKSKKKSKK